MTDRDPGKDWIEAALSPLRRIEADINVAPGVMARIRAERGVARRGPAVLLAGRAGLAWASSLLAGISSLGILASMLYGHAAAGGPGQSWPILRSMTAIGVVLVHALSGFVATLAAVSAPLLRGAWALLDAAAPLFRGAGLIAATCGALSILVSLFVFAQARRTAPLAGTQGGIQ